MLAIQDFLGKTVAEMPKDPAHDTPIAPNSFGEFVGQDRMKQRIQFAVNAARHRGEPLGHVLLVGPPGSGKGTLAKLIHSTTESGIRIVSGRAGGSGADFVGLLTTVDRGDFIFIEDVDALSKATSEYLCEPMKDFKLDIWIDKGPNARSVRLNLPQFTLIGMTTSRNRLSPAFLSSFEIIEEFTLYTKEELSKIARRFAKKLNLNIDEVGSMQIASGSCELLADVLNTVRHLRDYVYNNPTIKRLSSEEVIEALKLLTPTVPKRGKSNKGWTRSEIELAGDPLKRRYQVFVSFTYDDLKEERRQVMQALLETKCIPTGMELFPAGSERQWELIQRVIDDCDYYIVVLAGRYGSIGPNGLSYTEMEFDYAIASGKSVIGFYHSDPSSLIGSKLERNGRGRHKLASFAQKVQQRICKSWSTPEGLASAIKSAILHAIEHDQKPGWVRASDLPTSASIANLKRSVERSPKS